MRPTSPVCSLPQWTQRSGLMLDDTQEIQGLLDAAGRVRIPNIGRPYYVRPLTLSSDCHITMDPGVVIQAKMGEFHGSNDRLLTGSGISNVTIVGYNATLKMRKENYRTEEYEASEHRHALALYGCSNVKVYGLTCQSSGGDGFYFAENAGTPCSSVFLSDCVADDNYRNGLSIVSASGFAAINCTFKNTEGTSPRLGVDIEPGLPTNKLENILFRYCRTQNNAGGGFQVHFKELTGDSDDVSVTVQSCVAREPTAFGILVQCFASSPGGHVTFEDFFVEATNKDTPAYTDKWNSGANVDLNFKNVRAIKPGA